MTPDDSLPILDDVLASLRCKTTDQSAPSLVTD
jgi:hypothetical protein